MNTYGHHECIGLSYIHNQAEGSKIPDLGRTYIHCNKVYTVVETFLPHIIENPSHPAMTQSPTPKLNLITLYEQIKGLEIWGRHSLKAKPSSKSTHENENTSNTKIKSLGCVALTSTPAKHSHIYEITEDVFGDPVFLPCL